MLTINNVLIKNQNLLKQNNIAKQETDLILSFVLNRDLVYLYTYPEYKISWRQYFKFIYFLKKRLHHYPLAYITGHKEFYQLDFKVNKHTLIPRPESELFIDELLKINPNKKNILDIGTGSGCLIITIAKLLSNNNFYAIDNSQSALNIAKKNAKYHNVSINFIKNDLLNNINNYNFDIIIANLPYLTPEELTEPSITHEPKSALVSGQDGLDHYKKLLTQISKLDYKPQYILLEINPNQKEKISEYINTILTNYKIKIIKDLNNLDRIIKIIKW